MAKQTFTTGQVLTAAQMTSLQQTAMLGGSASAKVASYTLVAADAGTTVSMSNAGATTITVNTGLFAAGDTVTILNVGAGACTITAGTATVSKPTNATLALVTSAGGVLYFTATGAATFLPFDVGAGASTPSFVGCKLYNSAAQSISTGTDTIVTFDSEDLDTNGFHSTSSNTGRITIPSGYAGKYLIYGYIGYTTINSSGYRELNVLKNGTGNLVRNEDSGMPSVTNNYYPTPQITLILDLAVADYVELQAFQNSGISLNIGGFASMRSVFQCVYLGA